MKKKAKKKAKKTGNNIKMKPTALTVTTTPWGSYEYIYEDLKAGIVIKKLTIKEGHRFSLQYHVHRAEYWKINSILNNSSICNSFSITIEDDPNSNKATYICERNYNLYKLIKVPLGCNHRAEALVGDLEIIETSIFSHNAYSNLEEFEADIRRIHDDYGRL